MKTILKILILAGAIMALSYFNLVSGVTVDSFYSAFIVALVLGGINVVIKPIIKLLTLPVNILTLGFFGLIVNGLLLWFVASFVQGFGLLNFTTAFIVALIISIVSWILELIF